MKYSAKKQSCSGFTIIEVIIVLAIAGLILLVIFLAIPALQRHARNNARKTDVIALAASIAEFRNNHSGQVPIRNGEFAQVVQATNMGYYNQEVDTYTRGSFGVWSCSHVNHCTATTSANLGYSSILLLPNNPHIPDPPSFFAILPRPSSSSPPFLRDDTLIITYGHKCSQTVPAGGVIPVIYVDSGGARVAVGPSWIASQPNGLPFWTGNKRHIALIWVIETAGDNKVGCLDV